MRTTRRNSAVTLSHRYRAHAATCIARTQLQVSSERSYRCRAHRPCRVMGCSQKTRSTRDLALVGVRHDARFDLLVICSTPSIHVHSASYNALRSLKSRDRIVVLYFLMARSKRKNEAPAPTPEKRQRKAPQVFEQGVNPAPPTPPPTARPPQRSRNAVRLAEGSPSP